MLPHVDHAHNHDPCWDKAVTEVWRTTQGSASARRAIRGRGGLLADIRARREP